MPQTPITTTSPTTFGALRFREAFERTKPELATIEASKLLVVNLNIPASIVTVTGCLPKLAKLRDLFIQLPLFDFTAYEKLETYALALGFAHTQFVMATTPDESAASLAAELLPIREVLVAQASVLALLKLINGDWLKALQGTTGFRNLAFDVLHLSLLLRERWNDIQGKTAVELAELNRADQLADRLVTAVGLKEQGNLATEAAIDNRRRAFTLFLNAYQEVRRGVVYLRGRERDADRIAPSLFVGRGGSRKKIAPLPTEAAIPPTSTALKPTQDPASTDPLASTAPGMPMHEPFDC